MKYLKVDVVKELHSSLLIEVPDDFVPNDIRKYDVQQMVEEELYDRLCWGDDEIVSIETIREVPEDEAKMYGITKLSNYPL